MARRDVVDAVISEPLAAIRDHGIVPVMTIDRIEDSEPIAEALVRGGLPCAEVTFRSGVAAAAIGRMAVAFPELVIGAGTVLSPTQAEVATEAGARFIVGPGFHPAVVEWCRAHDMPIVPGAMTPTEIAAAVDHGIDLVKFFPSEAAGGVRTLEALAAPFPGVEFMPSGGIDASNVASYLRLPMVAACGGSWLVDRGLVDAGDFAAITARTAAAVALVREARNNG